MAQTAMSETYGKTRGLCTWVEGQALGSQNVGGWGQGLQSPCLEYRDILQTSRCLGPGGDTENLGLFRVGLGS